MTAADVRGYVLAGGEGSRMQRPGLPRDKALLELGGETLLARALATLAQVCPGPHTLCGGAERCERLRPFGPTVPDAVRRSGPLGGVHAALMDAQAKGATHVMVVPVDQPWMSVAMLRAFLREAVRSGASSACMRAAGTVQPLPVIVRLEALRLVQAALLAGERKLRPVLESVATQCGNGSGLLLVDVETFGMPAGAAEACFRNLNTPDDYERTQRDETLRGSLHLSKHGG